MRLASQYGLRRTPQSQPIPGTVPNSAGGHAFAVDDWTRLQRFLVLGSETGSYYAAPVQLTAENAQAVVRCLAADGPRALAMIDGIHRAGRAPKTDPALFALALATATSDAATRAAALAMLPGFARTGGQLLALAAALDANRGWGRGLRRAIARWHLDRPVDELAFQAVKYRQRAGWSQRDLLRLAHPVAAAEDVGRRALFDWICRGTVSDALPEIVRAAEALKTATPEAAAALIRAHRLPREAVPSELLATPEVGRALLDGMPATALIRSLAAMTASGLLRAGGPEAAEVVRRLDQADQLRRARVHPLAILLAARTYAAGCGLRGRLRWAPAPEIVEALDRAFHAAFAHAPSTGRRVLVAVDVSGSMSTGEVAGTPLTPREAAAALALVIAAAEPEHRILGFCDRLVPLPIRAGMTVAQATEATAGLPFGRTDCALPMTTALEQGWAVDAFVVLTDSETWAGPIHPVQALAAYRARTGIPAKLVVVGLVANGFTIADPDDAGMLDVVGFDAAVPQLVADFIAS